MTRRNSLATLLSLLLAAAARPAGAQQPSRPSSTETRSRSPDNLRATNRTAYSDKTELFITFTPPPIVGQAVRLSVHLSKVGDRFRPYVDATVAATLSVAGASTTTSVPKPDRPGLFRLTMTPKKPGIGTLVIDIGGKDGTDKLTLTDIEVYAYRDAAIAHQGADTDIGAIRYAKEHAWDENEYASAVVNLVALDSAKPYRRVLAIPRSAVVDIDGIPHVYLQRHPEAFDLVAIKLGTGNASHVQVMEGLRRGQRIVVRGGAKMPKKPPSASP